MFLEATDAVLEDGEHERLLAGDVAVGADALDELLGQDDVGGEQVGERFGIAIAGRLDGRSRLALHLHGRRVPCVSLQHATPSAGAFANATHAPRWALRGAWIFGPRRRRAGERSAAKLTPAQRGRRSPSRSWQTICAPARRERAVSAVRSAVSAR